MSSSLNGLLRSNSLSGSSHTPSFATAFSAQNSSIASDSVSLVSSSESQLKLDSKRNHFRAFVCFSFMWIMMDKNFLNF